MTTNNSKARLECPTKLPSLMIRITASRRRCVILGPLLQHDLLRQPSPGSIARQVRRRVSIYTSLPRTAGATLSSRRVPLLVVRASTLSTSHPRVGGAVTAPADLRAPGGRRGAGPEPARSAGRTLAAAAGDRSLHLSARAPGDVFIGGGSSSGGGSAGRTCRRWTAGPLAQFLVCPRAPPVRPSKAAPSNWRQRSRCAGDGSAGKQSPRTPPGSGSCCSSRRLLITHS